MYFFKLFLSSIVLFTSNVYSYNNSIFYAIPFERVLKNSTNFQSSIIQNNELKNILERKLCGESLKHIAGLIIDKSDKESKIIVEGSIRSNKLILKLGNIKEKELNIKNIILPIETISSKCINIRQNIKQEDSTILCLENKVLRNFWINSITDAILCYETKIKGKLPKFNYINEKENNKENEINQDNKENEINEENKENEINEDNKENEINKDNKENEINEENKVVETNEENKVVETNEKLNEEVSNEESIEKFNEELKKKILEEEFEDQIEKNEEQKGLKLRIAKSKYGYPKVKINGTNLDEFQKKNKSGELRSTNIENNENLTNLENDILKK